MVLFMYEKNIQHEQTRKLRQRPEGTGEVLDW